MIANLKESKILGYLVFPNFIPTGISFRGLKTTFPRTPVSTCIFKMVDTSYANISQAGACELRN